MDDEYVKNLGHATDIDLVSQAKLDKQLATWHKNARDNQFCYKKGVDMPPPLYDDDLKMWIDNECLDLGKMDKEKIVKAASFFKNSLTLEIIKLQEEAQKRYEESRKLHEAWRNSDEYKQFMKDIENY